MARGQPTTSRYRGASVFADHASGFTYVHLHQAMTTQETLDSKHAFECIAEQHAVRIRHYHCDNGRFAARVFMDDIRKAGQTITFCGVRAQEWGGREAHSRHHRKCLHHALTCRPLMAQDHHLQHLATSTQTCHACSKCSSKKRENTVSHFIVLQHYN